ncbi:MAG TPA: hypothetical protein VGF73_11110 [Chthoniobacterales bacterium]
MKSPKQHRSIDTSLLLFLVLIVCASGGVYCVFHYAPAREMTQDFLALRDQREDPLPDYLSILIPSDPSQTPLRRPAARKGSSPAPPPDLRKRRRRRAQPETAPALEESSAIDLQRSGLRHEFQNEQIVPIVFPAGTMLLTPGSTAPRLCLE